MKNFRGEAACLDKLVVGVACTSLPILPRPGRILVAEKKPRFSYGLKGLVIGESGESPAGIPTVRLKNEDLAGIADGDCITLSPDGTVSVAWDVQSVNNSIFATPSCDCRCIMCPQPPLPHDPDTVRIASETIDLIDPQKVQFICVTGGEPTLLGDQFLELMRTIKNRFDHARVLVLTNGKNFSDAAFARKYAEIGLSNCITCVSLHSDLEELNDEIAGVKGSFHKTVQGLYNLAKMRQRVEIRHVISKLNAHRLESFAWFIYRNFPFAYHIAFMGMEMTGCAVDNYDRVWIDPMDYRQALLRGVKILDRTALYVSIYNIPHCLLEQDAWPFARQSISDWKNAYPEETCGKCQLKGQCCGVFATSGGLLSPNISPTCTG
ncbi:His-Xaa-Ser system radical SAM maturase HxsC [Geobacter hydrogenophilus]|uniref:His-Xaa-Ser system radical SAM maturase HxsC n=1 Tax=Geobacter hydrogenophilus TaxID=40983 RepID=A0A9W6FZ92_9BACT|nr:His-Xaa-Ser system radical SAM maturase HxsC [Geobacter hydrogenophilus]MBT0893734.1 His-Xaa-Ser system radical SAM maturase HxsC [Geobacter hydrogenophilus]GLI37570.1 His-Xaa-Ser system radical SAM maturase HxsC [Geobacter hydrogenophilus]